MGIPTLWNLKNASASSLTNVSAFTAALRQHLHYTPRGLSAVLLQIKEEQSSCIIQTGCPGCATDRCIPGCRVDLLRRVIGIGYPGSQLSLVERGLLPRPYTRAVLGWPGAKAQPLDASVLQGWVDARLTLHWCSRPRPKPGLYASAVLCVGDGADDPLQRLNGIGWEGRTVPSLARRFLEQPRIAPRCVQSLWLHEPYLLTPVAATTHWLMTPPTPQNSAVQAGIDVGYANGAAIIHHLQEAGARVEMLDLERDAWTAHVAATTTEGDDPRPVLESLQTPAAPLEIRDLASGTVALDRSQARPSGQTPPLLYLGTRRDGCRRWRPLSATHHLVLSGPIEGGMIMGMLAPVIRAHPELRVGVLDVTTAGTLAVDLLELPGRLPTADGRNVTEVLGAIGGLEDSQQPTLVVLIAGEAAAAEAAVVPLLRAAMYRPVSVLLVVPELDAIPPLLHQRCPLIQVQRRAAQWQSPQGEWQWADPTVLRLPWRDPHLSWPELPPSLSKDGRHVPLLPPLEDFWVVPADLELVLAPDRRRTTPMNASTDHPPPPPAEVSEQASPGSVHDATAPASLRRSRVYPLTAVVAPPGADSVPKTSVSSPDAVAPLPALPRVASDGETASSLPAADIERHAEPLPPVLRPALSNENVAYRPREDSSGKLIVDEQLLVMTLLWAEQTDADNRGVQLTRFHRGLGLPSKAHSFDLRDALRLHGLIRREVREGWYRLLTVEEAVKAGKLPAGPWYTPSSTDSAARDSAAPENTGREQVPVSDGSSAGDVA